MQFSFLFIIILGVCAVAVALAVLVALREVVGRYGIPASIYSDRASWAFETPKAGQAVSKTHLTQVGEVLKRLGVEHIPSYSPQARGRSERMNETLQGRLVNELALAGARSIEEANRYIRESYLATHDQAFAVPPQDPAEAFVAADGVDLDEVFCRETVRTVGRDNVVTCGRLALQISKQPGRRTCAGLAVIVKQHLDASWSIHRGPQVLGRYDEHGQPREKREEPRLPRSTLSAGTRRRRSLPQPPVVAS